jgi:hypothetical protein
MAHKAEFMYKKIETWHVFVRGMTYVGNEHQNFQKRKDDGLTTCIFCNSFSLKWVSGPAKQRLIAQGFAQPFVQLGICEYVCEKLQLHLSNGLSFTLLSRFREKE